MSMSQTSLLERSVEISPTTFRSVWRSHDPSGQLPLSGYATLMGTLGGVLGVAVLATKPRNLDLSVGDIALLGLGTFQLAHLIARDRVVAPLRAPFTVHEKSAGAGEVEERPRGRGLQLAIGELVTCPYCLAPWVASGLSIAAALAPRRTRWLAAIVAMVTVSNICQQGYAALRKASK